MRKKLTGILISIILSFTSMDNIVFAEQADAVYMTESETQQTEEAEEEERKTVDYTEIESESSIEINTENYTEIISEIETESLLTTASTTEIETQEESDTEKTVIEESGTNDSEICDTEPIAESEIQTTTEIETETMIEIKEKDKRRTTKATGKDITRIEWLNALTNTFEMTVEENNYPDNYFSDISPDSSYYHNVMLAAEFGLINVEAGEAFCPDADATREFAVHTLNLCLQYAPLSENYTFAESETVLYPEDIQVAVELEWFELDTDNRFYPEQTLKESEKDFLIDLAQEEVLSQKVDSNYHNSFHFKEGVIVLPEGVNAALTNDDEITLTDCDIEIKEGDIFGLVVSGFPFAKKAQNIDIEGNKQIISVSEVSQEEAFQEIDVQGSSDISLTSIQMADEENIRLFYIVGGTRERNWTDGQKYEKLVGISESEITAVEIVKTYELSPKQRAQFEIADGVNAQITCTIENIDVDWKDSFTECMVLLNSDVRFHFNLSIDVFQALGVKPSIEVARVPVLLFGYASISASLDLSGSVTLDMVEYTSLGIKYMKHNRFGDRFRFVKEFRKKSFTIQAKTKLTITLTLMFGFDLGFMNGNLNGDWGATVTVDTKTFNDGEVPNTCMHVESWMFVNTGGYVKVKHLLQKDELWDYRNEIYTKLNSPVKVSFHYEDGQAVDRCTRDKTGTRYKYYSPADSRYGYNGGSGGIGSNGEPYTIFEYSLDEYENATITSYNGNVSALSIPQVLDGYTVIGIERGVFKDNNLLNVVVIPDHVEEIGDEAFMDCKNLSIVKLPKSLKKMGKGVFNNCDAITEIEIPKNLKDMNRYDFSYGGSFTNCDGLKKVVFEQGTTEIANYLFSGCPGIEEIEIPDTVTIIERMSFYNCANLSKVTIPASVKTIEGSAFANCPKLDRIEIPDSVEEIENEVFRDCLKLSDVKLSKNLKKMGAGVFNNCNTITEIEIPKSLKDTNRYDFSYGGPFTNCDGLKKVIFEQGTTEIANYLFSGCSGIEEIEIPDTVTIIEHMSFYNCANLSKVTIPASVKTIESSAFENCPKLQKIEIPDSVTILENSIFEGCSNLKEAILPKEIVNIPDCTFKDCVRLEKVNFPVSLESIKEYAFYQTNLKEVSFPDKLKSLEDYVFYNCDSLTVVKMNSGLIEIGDYVFYDCDSLTEMAIPDSVTSFGKSAFSECELLSDVTLGTGITVIPTNAFHLCPSLEKMILPYRTAEIKANAFTNCTKLTEITIPRSVTTIAGSVFSYPGKLTIYGISGTYAETYANQIGAAFVNKEVSAADVTLNTTELTMLNGAKYAMILSVIPMDFTDEVTWQSSNPDIVVIDKDGMLTAKAVGTTNVRVAVGEKTAVCAVTVVQPVTRISLNKSSLALEAFEEYALTATVYPSDAADKSIEWTSSDDSVAMISQTGLVTPVSKGTAVITAKAKDGSGKYGSCEITVMSDGQLCTKYIDLESEHNYANNMNKVWKYQYSGAKTLDVIFDEQTAIDEYGDFIYLYDGEDNELQKATGTSLAGQTIHITGDTVKIKLVSDKAVTAWGFRVSKLAVDGKEINPDDETPVEKPVNILTVTYDMQEHGEQIPPAEVKSGEKLIKPSDPAAEDYIFKGWYKEKACFNKWDFENDTVTAHMTLYAHWIEENPTEEPSTEQHSEEPSTEAPSENSTDTEDQGDGLWISGISKTGYTYTGEAIKPAISVYDKTTLLTEKTDYSITYKNNTKAGTATVIVTGRGNYSGKETVSFDILPADIGSQEVHAMDFYVKIGKKAQKPVPELCYMGAKLKNNKDFTISYSNATNIYLQPGEYNATISGKGNYTGTRTIKLTAVEKLVKPKPVSITKATINGLQKTFIYTGKACKQACILTINTSEGQKNLTEGVDYIAKYINNTKAGTASVTYYGKNGYTGKVKKTYKILPYNILEDSNAKIKYDNHFECVYAKGGSKPKPVVTFDGKALKEGTDYTLSYKNNKAVSGSQTPCVVVNGKGCFKGKIPIYFTITAQDLSQMMLVSGDKLYKPKADIYRITPKLMDLDGKLLSAGKDFDKKSITYVYENDVLLENGMSKSAGSAVESTDIIPSDTQIRITLDCGTGSNYKGRFSGIYRIVKADIKTAKVTIPKQIYTGKEIVLDKSQITVKSSGVILKPDEFEIVRYDNNIKKGKASVTLRGTGNYGGIKTVKFDIGTKGLLWWWKR